MGPSPCSQNCSSGHCTNEYCDYFVGEAVTSADLKPIEQRLTVMEKLLQQVVANLPEKNKL